MQSLIALGNVRRWGRALLAAMATRRGIAVRASLAVGLTLAAGAAAGDLAAGMLASQGGFAVLYATHAPHRRRAQLVALVGVWLALSAGLGTLAAESVFATIIVGGLYATASALMAIALRLGPPREFFPILVFLLVAQLPVDRGALTTRVGLVLAGAALAWLLSMSSVLTDRIAPQQRAAARALLSIADLLEKAGSEDLIDARHHAIVAARAAVIAADETGGAVGRRAVAHVIRIERLLEAVIGLGVEGAPPLDRAWVGYVRALAAPARDAAATPAAWEALPPLPDHPAVPRFHAAASALQSQATDTEELASGELSASLPARSRWPTPSDFSWLLRPPHPRIALRTGTVVSLGLLVGNALALERAAWIATSAAAVLQGAHARVIGRRALHRALGTLLGVLVAHAVLRVELSVWGMIAVIALLQYVVELLITASYTLAMVAITPLVLLLSALGGGQAAQTLAGLRLIDTLVGCVIAALVVIVMRSWRATGRLPSAQAAVMAAFGAVLDCAFEPQHDATELTRRRRHLQAKLLDLRVASEEAVGDAVWSDPTADARWPITALLERGAHLALTFPRELARGDVDREALRRCVRAMTAAIAQPLDGAATRVKPARATLPAAPRLPLLHRTNAVLAELQATLRGGRT